MDYTSLRTNAAASITKNGKAVTLRIPAQVATYDPVAGTGTPAAAVDYACMAVEIGYKQGERDGTIVQVKDRQFLVAGLTTAGAALTQPTSAWQFIVSGVTLQIVYVEPLNPGETNIIYTVQCRG